MKIAYFINTFDSINWGGQATSSGIQHMIAHEYPNAEFIPLDLPDLPFKKLKLFRYYYDRRLLKALLADNVKDVLFILGKMNIPQDFFDKYSHICFNGEGSVHYASGHLIRFMGLLYLAKIKGKIVASINQTIDLNKRSDLEALVSKVYNLCNFVSVREPLSYTYAHQIGIKNCRLIPDAVYGLPKLTDGEIDQICQQYNLPEHYISITGSSILKRDSVSLRKMQTVIEAAKEVFVDLPVIFMANAKTDIYLARKLKDKYSLILLEAPALKYRDAIGIFANAEILIGGRQHPNIFAYIYETPYLAFDGNTFKNKGVSLLQEYPYLPISFDTSKEEIIRTLKKIKESDLKFPPVKIKDFRIFG